jgi:hypothetical protein
MIPYMNLNEQADSDFSRARRRALLHRVLARFRRKPAANQLLSFDDVRRELRANNQTYLGTRAVEVEKIVGSVGRWSDFDPSFLPARASVGERWKRIDRAFHRGEDLPPVELYKIGQAYFVVDGNHRVSVARYHGAQWIDARVTEVRGPVSEKTRLRPESREHRAGRQERSRSKVRKEPAQKRPARRPNNRHNRLGEEVASLGILEG